MMVLYGEDIVIQKIGLKLKIFHNINKIKKRRIIMRKVVINRCYGGFGLSLFAEEELKKQNIKWSTNYEFRENPELIALIEQYGSEVISGEYSNLKIVEIPDKDDLPEYEIDEYDGIEVILDPKRIWK